MPEKRRCLEAAVSLSNRPRDFSDTGMENSKYMSSIHMAVLRPSEAYVSGQMCFHIHVGIGSGRLNKDTQELCAVLYGVVVNDGLADCGDVARINELDIGIKWHDDRSIDDAVLIYSGKESEHRKGMRASVYTVRSRVRLTVADECPIGGADVLEHRFGALTVPVVRANAHREPGRASRIGTSLERKLPRDVVERAINLVEYVAHQDAPAEERRNLLLGEAVRQMAGLRVVLASDAVEVSVGEGSALSIQRCQMLSRPLGLLASAVQRVPDHWEGQ